MLIVFCDGCRVIICRQLERNKDYKKLRFFQSVFVEYARILIDTLLYFPFYCDTVDDAIGLIASKLMQCWLTQSFADYISERNYEMKIVESHRRRVAEKKKIKKIIDEQDLFEQTN